jgi:hypothetical protein
MHLKYFVPLAVFWFCLPITAQERPTLLPAPRVGPVPGKPTEERLDTVTAVPTIEGARDGFSLLKLPAIDGHAIELFFYPDAHFPAWEPVVSSYAGKTLTFSIWQTKVVSMHDTAGNETSFHWECVVETIKDGSEIIYDARICELHKVPMARVLLPVQYGYPGLESVALNVESRGFPHGLPFSGHGGCVVFKGAERKKMSYQCSQCVAAYLDWRTEQDKAKLKGLNTPNETPSAARSAPAPSPVNP